MIKAAIFDFDGAICDSFQEMMKCFQKVLQEEGVIFDINNVRTLQTKGAKDFFISFGLEKQRSLDVLNRVREIMEKRNSKIRLFSGVEEIYKLESMGVKISILSSSKTNYIKKILEQNSFKVEILEEIISEDNLYGKGQHLKEYIDKHGFSADEIIYIGDEVRDIEAANQIKVPSVAVTWGYNELSLLKTAKPTFIAKSFQDLVVFTNRE